MAWLRIDDQRCLNRKIGKLSDGDYRALDALLSFNTRAKTGGNFDRHDLQFAIYVTPTGPRHVTVRHVNSFVRHGLVDETEEGWIVHDWDVYQPKDPTAADRMQRYRDRNADRNGPVTSERNADRDSRARVPSRPVPEVQEEQNPPTPNPALDVAADETSKRELIDNIIAGQTHLVKEL